MLTRIQASQLPVEQFAADLQRVCGAFGVRPGTDRPMMRGRVATDMLAGLEIAHVAADVQQVCRTSRDIKRDGGENYFLILQEEGRALMSQNAASCVLHPGDMVLIDSACPSEFTFFGDYNRQLSLHLPRGEMHARFGYDIIRGGISLPRRDPTTLALCAVLGKVLTQATGQSAANPASNAYLREAIYGLIGASLHERSGSDSFAGIDSDLGGAQALAAGRAYLDSHYRNPDLTIQDMADDLGISPRQLQRGFSAISSTPTKYLLGNRLEHAKRGMDDRRAGRRDSLISTIAYEAGFSDLSYFQRCFRRAFGTSPKAYASGED